MTDLTPPFSGRNHLHQGMYHVYRMRQPDRKSPRFLCQVFFNVENALVAITVDYLDISDTLCSMKR